MTDDIVTLLRKYQPYNKLHGQAADEIERLQTERDKWKLTAERLAGQLSGQGWPDDWTVIEQAQWGM